MKQMTEVRDNKVLDLESIPDQTVFLEIENELLKEQLGLSDFCSYFAEDMDPLSLNDFLRHMIFMENIGPEKPIRSLFPPKTTFPPSEDMNEDDLVNTVKYLREILMDNGILLELSPNLPADITYKYINEKRVMAGSLIILRPF